MTEVRFLSCLEFTLAEEGGFSQDSRDCGGATKFGVTIATLSRWRGSSCNSDDVKNMEHDEAKEIYYELYWQPILCGEMADGIDLQVFDFGVNAGIGCSAKLLQRAVQVSSDGIIGPITLSALRRLDPILLINRLTEKQDAFYRSLADFSVFGNGWIKRLKRRHDRGLSMVANASQTH